MRLFSNVPYLKQQENQGSASLSFTHEAFTANAPSFSSSHLQGRDEGAKALSWLNKLNPAVDGGLLHPYPCTVNGTRDYDFQTMFERDLRLHGQVYLIANSRSMDSCFYATELVATKPTTIP